MNQDKLQNLNLKFTYWALAALAAFCFTSLSLSAIFHILIFLPGLYFSFEALKENKFNLFKTYSKTSLALLAFIFIFLISSIINSHTFDNPIKGITSVKYFLLGFLSIKPFEKLNLNFLSPQKTRGLVNLFLGATTLATFSGLLAIIIDFNILKMKKPCHPFRACGTYGMTITYGYGIALALILFVVLFYQRKKLANYFNQYLLYASLFFNSLGLYFSYARGGLIGFFIGACSILFFINKKIFALMMVITLSGIVTLVFLSKHPTFSSRLLVPWEQPTNLLRIHQSQAALSASVEHPWWGLGFRNFEGQSIELKKKYGVPFIPGYENWKGHAHNNYLETLVGCGYMAFIFFCLWHVGWLIKTFQTKGALFYFGPFVVVHMVIGLFQSTIIDGENMFLIMGIFAISEAISRTQSRVVDL